MRKRHNGFTKFMSKLEGKRMVDPNRPLQVGDLVLVKSTGVSAAHLGRPQNFVGDVRQVYSTRELLSGQRKLMYSLHPDNLGAWYLSEDLELVE